MQFGAEGLGKSDASAEFRQSRSESRVEFEVCVVQSMANCAAVFFNA